VGKTGSRIHRQQQRHLVTNTRVRLEEEVRYMKKERKKKKRKGRRGKNYYTKFFGGKLLFEHLHSPTHTQYLVAKILNWHPVYQKTLTCATKNVELCVVRTKNGV